MRDHPVTRGGFTGRFLTLAVVVGMVGGGVAWLRSPGCAHIPMRPSAARGFPTGEAQLYRLEVEAAQRVETGVPGADPVEAGLSLVAVVAVAPTGGEGGDQVLVVMVERIEQGRLYAAGQSLEEEALERAVRQGTAWLRVAPSGRVTGLATSPDAGPALVAVASALRLGLQHDSGPGDAMAWSVPERGLAGELVVGYLRGQEPGHFQKRADRYLAFDGVPGRVGQAGEVEGGGTQRTDPRGFVAEATVAERFALAAGPDGRSAGSGESWVRITHLGGTRLDARQQAPPPGSFAGAGGAGQRKTSEQAGRGALESLAVEMPATRVRELLGYIGLTGKLPPDRNWIGPAAARLALDPSLLGEVATAFRSGEATAATRTKLTELLVLGATPEAQRLLVELLRPLESARDELDSATLQRAGFTSNPGPELTGQVRSRLDRELRRLDAGMEPGMTTDAVLLAAGTVASRLVKAGDTAQAEALTAPVLDRLGTTDSAAERLLLLGALGNAGLLSALPLLDQLAASSDQQVRAAAVDATRNVPGPDAREILVRGAADRSPEVQDRAYLALDALSLNASELSRLAGLVTRGLTSPGAQHRFLVIVSKRLEISGAEVAAALEWIMERGAEEERARAAFLRDALQ